MTPEKEKRTSKFLNLILRHKPETVGLVLDDNGWIDVDLLLEKMNKAGKTIDRSALEQVVKNNSKQRFVFSECGQRIRANQGHSVEIELGYDSVKPPEFLFHGAATKDIAAIRENGLLKMGRHDVHLNAQAEPCIHVASRHGKPIVLTIKSGKMHDEGFKFFLTPNNVWLTNHVPARFIEFENDNEQRTE